MGTAPSIVEEYLGSELLGAAAGFELFGTGAPTKNGFRPESLVVHDYMRDCTPQQKSSFNKSTALGSACIGEQSSPKPARRIVLDREIPLDMSIVDMVLGDATASKNTGDADLTAVDPQIVLDNTPLFAPDVGPTKWDSVLFSIGAITHLGPGELKQAPRTLSHSDFIGALMRPIGVVAIAVLFFFVAIAVFREGGHHPKPESATGKPFFKEDRFRALGKYPPGGERVINEPARQFAEPHPLEGYGAMEAHTRVTGGHHRRNT